MGAPNAPVGLRLATSLRRLAYPAQVDGLALAVLRAAPIPAAASCPLVPAGSVIIQPPHCGSRRLTRRRLTSAADGSRHDEAATARPASASFRTMRTGATRPRRRARRHCQRSSHCRRTVRGRTRRRAGAVVAARGRTRRRSRCRLAPRSHRHQPSAPLPRVLGDRRPGRGPAPGGSLSESQRRSTWRSSRRATIERSDGRSTSAASAHSHASTVSAR